MVFLIDYLVKCEDEMWLAESGFSVDGFDFCMSKLDKNVFIMKRENTVRK